MRSTFESCLKGDVEQRNLNASRLLVVAKFKAERIGLRIPLEFELRSAIAFAEAKEATLLYLLDTNDL